jgi:hypothetical protein
MKNFVRGTGSIFIGKDKYHYVNGLLHREDGPAIEFASGALHWYSNDKIHRVGSPAIINPNGYAAWYIDGKRHREDGPAIEFSNGEKAWYINGVKIDVKTQREFIHYKNLIAFI